MATIVILACLLLVIAMAFRSILKDKQGCKGNCQACGGCHSGSDLYQSYHQNS